MRLIEGIHELQIEPPDHQARWTIETLARSGPAEKINLHSYIQFIDSPSWNSATGDRVRIKITPPADGRAVGAKVTAQDSYGSKTVYEITTGGK